MQLVENQNQNAQILTMPDKCGTSN